MSPRSGVVQDGRGLGQPPPHPFPLFLFFTLLSSLEWSDRQVYEPSTRAFLGTASPSCGSLVLKLRTVSTPSPCLSGNAPYKTNPSDAARQFYRGTLLIRNSAPLGPYSRNMPRALWWPYRGRALSYERGTPVAKRVQERPSRLCTPALRFSRHRSHPLR